MVIFVAKFGDGIGLEVGVEFEFCMDSASLFYPETYSSRYS